MPHQICSPNQMAVRAAPHCALRWCQVIRYNTGSAVRSKNSRQTLTNRGLSKGIRRVKCLVAVSHRTGHVFSRKSFYASSTSPWPCMRVWQTAVCQMKSEKSSFAMSNFRCVTHTWTPSFYRKCILCILIPLLAMYEVPKLMRATIFFGWLRFPAQTCSLLAAHKNRSNFVRLARMIHAIFFKWDSAPRLTSLNHSFATDSDSFWPFKFHIFLRKLTNFTSICP